MASAMIRDEVRDALVDREFHAPGVDQDHAHLLRRRARIMIEVIMELTKEDSLKPVSGRRPACGVLARLHDVAALDVLADADDERVLVAASAKGTQDVAEGHVFAIGAVIRCRYAFAGDRREDANVGGGHRVGDDFSDRLVSLSTLTPAPRTTRKVA